LFVIEPYSLGQLFFLKMVGRVPPKMRSPTYTIYNMGLEDTFTDTALATPTD